jgi:hypothetical protein
MCTINPRTTIADLERSIEALDYAWHDVAGST